MLHSMALWESMGGFWGRERGYRRLFLCCELSCFLAFLLSCFLAFLLSCFLFPCGFALRSLFLAFILYIPFFISSYLPAPHLLVHLIYRTLKVL